MARTDSMNSKRRRKLVSNLLVRDGNLCHYCQVLMTRSTGNHDRVDATLTREHVVPLCFGGGNSEDNIVLCCNKCNNGRGNALYYCDCEFCITAYSIYYLE